jgi:Uma2 family endonuclease
MMHRFQSQSITGEEFSLFGDTGPYELVNGQIVPISPATGEHALVAAGMMTQLQNFIRPRQAGWVLGGRVGIYTKRNPDTVRGMDIAVISKARLPVLPKSYLEVAPEVVMEITSPDDRWKDSQDRLKEYFAIGVDCVWLIEPEDRTVFVYSELTEMICLGEEDVLGGEGPLTGFALPVAAIFVE